ncbi:cilia- and flagella-associated protein 299-like [Onthophagus taurus]|uniref:cilia- and flagella-associated protein 299-like n=1 Tax=Onthophagus taurus TaxID=166361 RepID=UPI000C1FE870|nr:uncharacterized protein C4orf22 homolog [Onthophagus taurus]
MSDPLQATPQIEADKNLVQFKSYDDYLDSLVTEIDHCYLENVTTTRTIAELGYRTSGETLTKENFERRLAVVLDYLYPKIIPYILVSENCELTNTLQKELSLRENANRLGIMGTIIFLRIYTKKGHEVSGYIDYADSLANNDWLPFFKGLKPLQPRIGDLGYYDWKTNKYTYKDSRNYKIVVDPDIGLMFQNRFDRKYIVVDPTQHPGPNSVRIRLATDENGTIIFYDHIVMQRI